MSGNPFRPLGRKESRLLQNLFPEDDFVNKTIKYNLLKNIVFLKNIPIFSLGDGKVSAMPEHFWQKKEALLSGAAGAKGNERGERGNAWEGPGQRRPGEGKRTSAPRSHAARSGRLIRSVRVYGRHGSRRRAREGRLLGKLFSGMAEASAFHRGGDRLLASKKRGGEEERPPAAGNERCPSSPDHV